MAQSNPTGAADIAAAEVERMSQALWDSDQDVAADALDGLSDLQSEDAVLAVSFLPSLAGPNVREDAVDVLVDLAPPDAEMHLRDALSDALPAVRDAAQESLAELGYSVD